MLAVAARHGIMYGPTAPKAHNVVAHCGGGGLPESCRPQSLSGIVLSSFWNLQHTTYCKLVQPRAASEPLTVFPCQEVHCWCRHLAQVIAGGLPEAILVLVAALTEGPREQATPVGSTQARQQDSDGMPCTAQRLSVWLLATRCGVVRTVLLKAAAD